MAQRTHEQTINTALGEVLGDLGRRWRMQSEQVGRIFEEGGRPDILIEKEDGWPIVIEAEVGNHRQAEMEAKSRLSNKLVLSQHSVHAAVALVYPASLRGFHGRELRQQLITTQLEWALFALDEESAEDRFPPQGWIRGTVAELAVLLHRSSVPAWRVESLATSLENGVVRAAAVFSSRHPIGSPPAKKIATRLGQLDDAEGQTRRMAMTVLVDALIFQAALTEANLVVQSKGEARAVSHPTSAKRGGKFIPSLLISEWERVLSFNYWPIFYTARAILAELPSQTSAVLLEVLWATAEELVVGGVTKSHDLTGVVFQRLIADRKFLATYYTKPSCAALLAGLALPISAGAWADQQKLKSMRVADFACGTGTLLSTTYQRLGLLHEISGGDPETLHTTLMEDGLVGLDVLNVAVHLTAAMLAGMYPTTPFAGECLLTMPYGQHQWGVCVGSLDLLEEQGSFDVLQSAALSAGGRGQKEIKNLVSKVGHGQFDIVIMNPPFTRHGAREGDRQTTHNPAFAAFGSDEKLQDELSARLHALAQFGCAHGHAGLASYFVELADRKIADQGILALVMPLSSMSGASWEKVRSLFRTEYSRRSVVTIAESSSHTRSFSADTGMAECLFVAKKGREAGVARARFAVLKSQPKDTLEGELLAQAMDEVFQTSDVQKLEDGPVGGTRIKIGNTFYGEVLDCPLPLEGPWQMVGIKDFTLGQTAYQLTLGSLWVEGMSDALISDVPITRLSDLIERIGPHHLDITGKDVKADGLPQGPFERMAGHDQGSPYPALWNHDTKRERSLIVAPDSHLRLRNVPQRVRDTLRARAELRWATATRSHYNTDLQFNSQSIIVATTDAASIGGRAWPSVVFAETAYEIPFALFANSTLGLLCHWWMSNKSQAGRGITTVSALPSFPTLDFRRLTRSQLRAANTAFGELSSLRFLPFDQMHEDKARAKLDRRLIVDVLGLNSTLCSAGGAIELLRKKLAAEPQIHSDKRSRLIFTPSGEKSVPTFG